MKNSFLWIHVLLLLASCYLSSQNLNLTLLGTNRYENTVLDSLSYRRMFPDYQTLQTTVDSLGVVLQKKGYLAYRLKGLERVADSLVVAQLFLGQRHSNIRIYYDGTRVSKSLLSQVSKHVFDDYFELNFESLESALGTLNRQLVKQGFPFLKLKLSDIEVLKGYLKSRLIIDKALQARRLDTIIVKGYRAFPKSFLKHYLNIRVHKIVDLEALKYRSERLNTLSFARFIKPPEMLFSKDKTQLYLYVKKRRSNTFDGFLGFGNQASSKRIRFDGYLNLTLENALNYGENFSLIYKRDKRDQSSFTVSTNLPYWFRSPVGLHLKLHIFKRDSSFVSTEQLAKLRYQVGVGHELHLGFRGVTSDNLLSEPQMGSDIVDLKARFLNLAYTYTKKRPNDLLFPLEQQCYLGVDIGSRRAKEQLENQSQFVFRGLQMLLLGVRHSLMFKVDGATLNTTSYYENELLRFGGTHSIRGFEEQSLYASTYGVLSTEYRYRLSPNFYVNSMTDVAYFENKINANSERLVAYGLGFGLLTKAGLLRFYYANGKRSANDFRGANYKVHMSLQARF